MRRRGERRSPTPLATRIGPMLSAGFEPRPHPSIRCRHHVSLLSPNFLAAARAQSSGQGARPQGARRVPRMPSTGTSRGVGQMAAANRVIRACPNGHRAREEQRRVRNYPQRSPLRLGLGPRRVSQAEGDFTQRWLGKGYGNDRAPVGPTTISASSRQSSSDFSTRPNSRSALRR